MGTIYSCSQTCDRKVKKYTKVESDDLRERLRQRGADLWANEEDEEGLSDFFEDFERFMVEKKLGIQ